MVLLVVGYNFFFAPDPVEPEPQEQTATVNDHQRTDTIPPTEEAVVMGSESMEPQVNDSARMAQIAAANASRFGVFAPSAEGESTIHYLDNGRVQLGISTHGGLFHSAILDEFHTFWDSTQQVSLWDPETTNMDLWVEYKGKGKINLSDLFFTKVSEETTDDAHTITMRLQTTDPNAYLEYRYALEKDGYEVKMQMQAVGLNSNLDLGSTRLDWNAASLHVEKGVDWERQHSSIYFREMGQGRDYLGDGREDDDQLEGKLNWMAFKQNFFSAAIISDAGFENGASLRSYPPVNKADTTVNMFYEAKLPLALDASDNSTRDLRFFFGPNDLDILNKLEVEEFGRIIDYGWWIFGWVNRNFVRPVFDFLASWIGNLGITIIVITILIKLLLSPVTWKNFVSSAKMRVLRPEMEEINEKYKDDSMGKQQATMALYRETGVNPFAGCLPMLLQLPILYAMFRFFPANIDLRGKSFLWADDLGAYDAIFTWTTEIPFISSVYGNHVSGFALMMAVSTFFYSRMSTANMPNNQQPGMPNMKVIMSLFPIITLVFFNKFAAGLNFYYFCANVISIIQMIVIKNYLIDEDKIHAKLLANKATPKKKSSFQQRLEEMQKLQKERTNQSKRK